jgi:hypothetical protein
MPMNKNKTVLNLLVVVFSAVLAFSSCKKTHEYTLVNTTDDTETQSNIASDELELNSELSQAVNEILAASTISAATSGDSQSGSGNLFLISGAVIDTSAINAGRVKITYYGKNADKTKGRLGDIEINYALAGGKLIPWNTKGASATIKFTNYEVFFLKITNKALSLNGSCKVTNVSGGLLKNIMDPALVPGDSLIEKVQAHLSYTYNDNATTINTWDWNCNQLRIFNGYVLNGKDTAITCTLKGDTTVNNIHNTASWGETRSRQKFYSCITVPMQHSVSGVALLSNPLIGRKVILGIAEPIIATYGVDKQGAPVSANDYSYGYIIAWTNPTNQPKQAVISYY